MGKRLRFLPFSQFYGNWGRGVFLSATLLLSVSGCLENQSLQPVRAHPEPVDLGVTGLPAMPDDNPLTKPGIALGRRLFFDKILSDQNIQSCSDCHLASRAFSDTFNFSFGAKGLPGLRNTPTLMNSIWFPNFFWDGRAATLEDQARAPVPHPMEMNLPWDQAILKLSKDKHYPDLFAAAFNEGPITQEKVVQALAQFERTLISFNSKFDRFLRGEVVLTEAESTGYALFNQEKTGCFHCHSGILFTDLQFHNNGIEENIDGTGRGAITGNPEDDGKFRTPTLRNLMLTRPFMHDGRFFSLEETLEHYSAGGKPSRTVDSLVPGRTKYPLSEQEIQFVLAFLLTLTDSTIAMNPDFQRPTDLP